MNQSGFLQTLALVVALIAVMFTSACGASAAQVISIDNQLNGKMVSLKAGQVLQVSLTSNPSTGYSWALADYNADVIRPQGEPEFVEPSRDKPLVGASGWDRFHFKVQKTGQTQLKLVYRRPWEKDVAPVQTFEVQVMVE